MYPHVDNIRKWKYAVITIIIILLIDICFSRICAKNAFLIFFRDLGVSPERINVTYRDIKQKSMEECNKQSSDDELLTLSEGSLQPKPGPSLKLSQASLDKVVLEEASRTKVSTTKLNESQENITVKMGGCRLEESETRSSPRIREEPPQITIPIIETSAPANGEEEEEEAPSESTATVVTVEEQPPPKVEISQPEATVYVEMSETKTTPGEEPTPISSGEQPKEDATCGEQGATPSDEQKPSTSAEPKPSTSDDQKPSTSGEPRPSSSGEKLKPSTSDHKSSENVQKTRKQPKKTRLLSEEGYRSGIGQKFDTSKQISVDLLCSMESTESTESVATTERTSSVEGIPEEGQPQKKRTDICPWEDE